MILSGLPKSPSLEKFLSQNPHFETKSFTDLVTEYFMKFEKIDRYFPSLGKDEFAFIRNPFTTSAQILLAGTGTQEELVKLQHNGFARDVHSEKNFWKFLVYDFQLIQKDCYTCC